MDLRVKVEVPFFFFSSSSVALTSNPEWLANLHRVLTVCAEYLILVKPANENNNIHF